MKIIRKMRNQVAELRAGIMVPVVLGRYMAPWDIAASNVSIDQASISENGEIIPILSVDNPSFL